MYETGVKSKKTVLLQNIDAKLYDEYKELTNNLRLNRDLVNKEIYEKGIKSFIHKYKKHEQIIAQEIAKATQKAVDKAQRRIGL